MPPNQRKNILLALNYTVEDIKRGIYEVAAEANWSVIDLQYYGMNIPRECSPDGVLFHLREEQLALGRHFLRLGVPAVQIDDFVFPDRFPCVVPDRQAVGQAAADHFFERGFRNMAYLHAETFEHSPRKTLGVSFVKRARELGAQADFICIQRAGRVIPWTRIPTLAKRFAKQIAKLPLPLGIFTYTDLMAARVCEYCKALGLSVPEQVAVLGTANSPYRCDFAPTPLSSVDRNHLVQGRVAAELLKRAMNGQPVPNEPILIPPTGVNTRKSTDVLAVPDLETARALRYIWEHIGDPLTTPRIARACCVSRSTLERRFRRYLDRSVNEEIVRKRIERGCELLKATDQPIAEIARQIGFATETYFFRIFRRHTGITPRKYRLTHTTPKPEAENANSAGM